MKVRILNSLISNVSPYRSGDIVLLNENEAKRLIKAGHAVEIKEIETTKAKIEVDHANVSPVVKKRRKRK